MEKIYVNTYYGIGGKTLQELGKNLCELAGEGQNKVIGVVKNGSNHHKIVIANQSGEIRSYTAQTIKY